MNITKIFASTLVAFTISASAFAQTVDEIVAKHIAAKGGTEKLSSIKTLVQSNSMSINGMDIPMVMTTVAGIGQRTEVTVMGNSMITVLTPGGGWMLRPSMMGGTGEPEDMPAEEAKKTTATDIDPAGNLFNYQAKGIKVELAGTEKVNGKDAFKLNIVQAGKNSTMFIDAASYMLVRTISPGMGGKEQDMAYSDYKAVDGILFPHTMTTESPMGGEMVISTDKIVVNGTVDESIFKKPSK
jgi:hypothetical protein